MSDLKMLVAFDNPLFSLNAALYICMGFFVYMYQINPALIAIPSPQTITGSKIFNPSNPLVDVIKFTKGRNKKEFAAITMFV